MDIKELRLQLGISQEELARRLGVSVQTIHRWESGKATPSRMAQQLLKTLFEERE